MHIFAPGANICIFAPGANFFLDFEKSEVGLGVSFQASEKLKCESPTSSVNQNGTLSFFIFGVREVLLDSDYVRVI